MFDCRGISELSEFHGRQESLTIRAYRSRKARKRNVVLMEIDLSSGGGLILGGAQHHRVVMVAYEGHHSEGCGLRWFQPPFLHMQGLGSPRAIEEHLNTFGGSGNPPGSSLDCKWQVRERSHH